MRVPAAFLLLSTLAPLAAADAVTVDSVRGPAVNPTARCPHVTSYLAGRSGSYRAQPLRPQKLAQLPPGTAYMAVYRRIGGCEDPLTMADYRNPRQR